MNENLYKEHFLKKIDIFEINKIIFDMSKIYNDDICVQYGMKKRDNIILQDRKKYWSKNRPNLVCEQLKEIIKYIKSGSVLDIGSGYGDHLCLLRSIGFQATGLLGPIISEDFIYVHKLLNLDFVVSDLQKELPFESLSFDLVMCNGVITLNNLKKTYNFILNEINRVSCKIIVINLHENNNYIKKEIIDLIGKDKFLNINNNFLIWSKNI
jgi:SAM-dependent methyltransferase